MKAMNSSVVGIQAFIMTFLRSKWLARTIVGADIYPGLCSCYLLPHNKLPPTPTPNSVT